MGVVGDYLSRRLGRGVERSDPSLSLAQVFDIVTSFSHQGINYTLPGATQEDIGGSFPLLVRGGYKSDVVVFACIQARMQVFAQARFAFRRRRAGGAQGLFTNEALRILERPWPNGTTGDLLSRMEVFASIAGNAYVVRRPGKLAVLRPDWTTIVGGIDSDEDASVWHPDAEILGYLYQEGGPGSGKPVLFFSAREVAHYAPIPDPEARFRGMSWLTPVVREVMADKAATEHKLKFFENAGTPNLVVKLDVDDLEKFQKWIVELRKDHEGVENAYKTLFLGAGADATVVGSNLEQMDFRATQGAGETRIAAASGTPPIVVGLSEGLQSATYSNYGQARRRFADNTIRDLWARAAGALQTIVDTPADAELWTDDTQVSALQEDRQDAANIEATKAQTIRSYIDGGFTPESAVASVAAEDVTLLKHTGLLSVQLQEPGANDPEPGEGSPSGNGAVPVPVAN